MTSSLAEPRRYDALVKPKVLVVEDERVILDLLAEHLVRGGFDAQIAATIERATTASKTSAPDQILSKVTERSFRGSTASPGGSGWGLAIAPTDSSTAAGS